MSGCTGSWPSPAVVARDSATRPFADLTIRRARNGAQPRGSPNGSTRHGRRESPGLLSPDQSTQPFPQGHGRSDRPELATTLASSWWAISSAWKTAGPSRARPGGLGGLWRRPLRRDLRGDPQELRRADNTTTRDGAATALQRQRPERLWTSVASARSSSRRVSGLTTRAGPGFLKRSTTWVPAPAGWLQHRGPRTASHRRAFSAQAQVRHIARGGQGRQRPGRDHFSGRSRMGRPRASFSS